VRDNAAINRHYQRKRPKTNGVVAIKSVAHKLARACYHILRGGTEDFLGLQRARGRVSMPNRHGPTALIQTW
jgi:hypothetical protein